jgi:hypothetical protein
MKRIIKISGLIFGFVIFGLLCSYLTYYKETKDNLISRANANLYDLGYTLDSLEYLDNSMDEPILREKLEISLISNLVLVNAINPKMTDLQGTPLSSLCRAIAYNRKNGIGINGIGKNKDKVLPQMTIDYLESIEPALREHVKSFQVLSSHECQFLEK